MIAIIDYGSGNVGAIMNIFRQRKIPHVLTGDPATLADADGFILPGVGAFDPTMDILQRSGIVDALTEEVLGKGKKVLGICVGMHLLAEGSDEGSLPGLGWIPGRVRKIDADRIDAKPKIAAHGLEQCCDRGGREPVRRCRCGARFLLPSQLLFRRRQSRPYPGACFLWHRFPLRG